jgi:hypothetical protein
LGQEQQHEFIQPVLMRLQKPGGSKPTAKACLHVIRPVLMLLHKRGWVYTSSMSLLVCQPTSASLDDVWMAWFPSWAWPAKPQRPIHDQQKL